MEVSSGGKVLHTCEGCGRSYQKLYESDDYVWVCYECIKAHDDNILTGLIELSDPDCVID